MSLENLAPRAASERSMHNEHMVHADFNIGSIYDRVGSDACLCLCLCPLPRRCIAHSLTRMN